MAGKIFINYRREDSIGTAGRLHDRLVQAFGRKNIFMDVDHIPAGVDFVAHLNSQVAACDVFLVIIGPHWLDAKDEAGQRRISQPDDFVAIEIAAALARDIRVVPVLVDGANVPKSSDLPDSLKPLARRQGVGVRQTHFGRDAEALVERLSEALDYGLATPGWRRAWTFGSSAAAVLILFGVGVGSYAFLTPARQSDQRQDAQADAKRQAEQAEQQRAAALSAEQERNQEQVAQTEARRQAEQSEQQRIADLSEAKTRSNAPPATASAVPTTGNAQPTPSASASMPTTGNALQTPSGSALSRGWIGLRIQAVTNEMADALDVKPPRGVLVAGVDEVGPAKAGGIQPGDVLLKFDGHDIKELHDFPRMVADTVVGQQVEIVLIRRGNQETHVVTMGRLKGGG
jgi:hypothetical protein